MNKKCYKCKTTSGMKEVHDEEGLVIDVVESILREYNESGDPVDGSNKQLPEGFDNSDEGQPITYCDICIDKANSVWWSAESNSYIFDEFGNNPNDEDYDP